MAVEVGDEFTLKCGTKVVVVEYKSWFKVVISNGVSTKTVQSGNLTKGKVVWEDREKYRVGSIHKTKKSGPCEVLSRDKESDRVTVKFLNTGTIKEGVLTLSLAEGTVVDPSLLPIPVTTGSRWESVKYGWAEVIEIKSTCEIIIKFDNTGNICKTSADRLRRKVHADDVELWDYLKPTKDMHYVYIASCDNEVVYVGQGKGRRYLHCNSGTSHSIELNRLYFEGKEIVVSIFKDNLTKQESRELEVELIRKYSPKCNIQKIPKI